MVLQKCESVIDATSRPVLLTEAARGELRSCITEMASSGLRTLCLAVRDFPAAKPHSFFEQPPSEALTMCCIVGIKASYFTESLALNIFLTTLELCRLQFGDIAGAQRIQCRGAEDPMVPAKS